MKKVICRFIVTSLAIVAINAVAQTSESFNSYINTCKEELSFQNVHIPNLDCYDGDLFDPNSGPGSAINDYMGYFKVTDQVDLVFACRWLFGSKTDRQNAVSIELLIHNRQSGNTCFFASKVGTSIVGSVVDDPWAASIWSTPAEIESIHPAFDHSTLRCVGCHVSGPYIASLKIAPFLAKYGLLNNGHDTLSVLPGRYHVVGATFSQWDNLARSYINPVTSRCADKCHKVGTNSPQDDIGALDADFLLRGPKTVLADIKDAGVMPSTNSPSNVYRWVNTDIPTNDDGGEYETLIGVSQQYPKLYCNNPSKVEAHVVGSDETISPSDLPDKLNRFNLQDGLVCLNNDQPAGRKCQDYQTRYMCNGKFTAFQNLDTPSSSGDWESRNSFKNLCANPTWIQARYKSGSTWIYANGPADRLDKFDNNGLVCYNADQNNGQCSNYVVRFECP